MAYKVKGTCVDAAFLVLGGYQTNVYVVSDGSATFVVDPASDAKKIAAALGGRKLDAIVLTHRHSDHVAAAAELRSLTGATVIASAIDADMICGDKPVPRDDQKFPACLAHRAPGRQAGPDRWRHAVLRLHRPHRLQRRQHVGHAQVAQAPGGPARRHGGPARPR